MLTCIPPHLRHEVFIARGEASQSDSTSDSQRILERTRQVQHLPPAEIWDEKSSHLEPRWAEKGEIPLYRVRPLLPPGCRLMV
jgi:hypothetical protein